MYSQVLKEMALRYQAQSLEVSHCSPADNPSMG